MIRLAGAVADGVFLTWARPEEIASKLALVREGAESAGRDPAAVEVVCSFWGYAGPDVERATDRLRRVVLSYATVPTHQRREIFQRLRGRRSEPGVDSETPTAETIAKAVALLTGRLA